jgi:hypothetical protein
MSHSTQCGAIHLNDNYEEIHPNNNNEVGLAESVEEIYDSQFIDAQEADTLPS